MLTIRRSTTGGTPVARSRQTSLNRREEFKQLKKLFNQPGPRNLLWHHSVGKHVEELCPDDARKYGSGGFMELAKKLRKPRSEQEKQKPQSFANLLSAKRKFYKTYRRDEIVRLNKQAKKGRFALTWSHVIFLITLDDPDRGRFQARCIKAGWSSDELHRRIKEHRGVKGRGGVRFRRPKTEQDNLRQLIEESEMWRRRFQEVWFPDDRIGICLDLKKAKSKKSRELQEQAVAILGKMQAIIEECLASQKRQAGKSK